MCGGGGGGGNMLLITLIITERASNVTVLVMCVWSVLPHLSLLDVNPESYVTVIVVCVCVCAVRVTHRI